jgi:SAM-dependent methyltransferase
MKAFWDERYSAPEYAYGTEPNAFLAHQLPLLQPGKALFAAEGEGRNAVLAAQLGWTVHAIDQSAAGKAKAQQLAQECRVALEYTVADLLEVDLEPHSYDLVVLIFAHFPPALRTAIHHKLIRALKPGGHLILEGFSKDHGRFQRENPAAGGPQEASMRFSEEELQSDFHQLMPLLFQTVETELHEGPFHRGKAEVVQLLAVLPS